MSAPAEDQSDRRQVLAERAIVVVAIAILCAGYGLVIDAGSASHYDHGIFEATHSLQRSGQSYYDAYLEAFAGRDVSIAEARGVRQPLIFLVWRWIPPSLLWPTFLLVVGAIGALMTVLTKRPATVVPVVAYLLTAGRIPSGDPIDQWLLVELWTLLPLTASVVFWRRGRDGPAAAFAVLAVLIREIAVGYLLLALFLAWRSGRERARIWLVALGVATTGYLAHIVAVQGHLAEQGNEAEILGTGDPPRTVIEMLAWMTPGPSVTGVAIFVVAVAHLATRRRDLLPIAGLFALAATGILVARPYWGFLFIPFGILLAAEQIVEFVASRRSSPAELPSSASGNG